VLRKTVVVSGRGSGIANTFPTGVTMKIEGEPLT
jgi:hypothetical protein